MCVGYFRLNLLLYEKCTKKNTCICTNGKLENGLMYLYWVFQKSCDKCLHDVYKIQNHKLNIAILQVKSMFTF